MDKPKKSLGRDVFTGDPSGGRPNSLKKILDGTEGKGAAAAKEVDVRIKLTPANIKHLDALRAELDKSGKGRYTRNELIRVAIMMLREGDF